MKKSPIRFTSDILTIDLFLFCSNITAMHDARAIANFFLDRADARGMKLSIMGLLKILFFAHAWYLAKEGKPLIAQPFEAFARGPVSRVVYDQFKRNGKEPISKRAVSFDVNRSTPRFLTFKQAIEVGGNVRKGEHGTKVYFVKQLQIKDRDGEEADTRLVPMLRE